MKPEYRHILLIVLVASAMLGCRSTTVINEYRAQPTLEAMHDDESIVILGRRYQSSQETEVDFIDCVGDSLANGYRNINVIPEQDFVDSMYPYFENSTAPMDVKKLKQLIQQPAFAERISDYRLRYFVWIDGFTDTTDSSGSISCTISPSGGGCFGFVTWDDEASYEATIWDFEQLSLSGKISADSEGTSYLPAVIIPVPLLAGVQSSACKSMAAQIISFIE